MDLITLAMAKAYTDKKVASGGGGLPMVELETVLGTGAPLSTADNEALTKAAKSAMPVILKGVLLNNGDPMPLCVVFNYMNGAYGATLAGMNAQFMPSASGQWAFSMS